jgi:hypothetical protein
MFERQLTNLLSTMIDCSERAMFLLQNQQMRHACLPRLFPNASMLSWTVAPYCGQPSSCHFPPQATVKLKGSHRKWTVWWTHRRRVPRHSGGRAAVCRDIETHSSPSAL